MNFYLKLFINPKFSENIFSELSQHQLKESDEFITHKFQLINNIILIKGEEDRILLRTLKWIDVIVDKKLREFGESFGMSLKKENVFFKSDETKKLIKINFNSKMLEKAFDELDDLVVIVQKSTNSIEFKFDFYNTNKKSEIINLKTKNGWFHVMCYVAYPYNKTFLIKWKGSLKKTVNVRIHHMCLTSEILGSVHCDCKNQLDKFQDIMEKENGMLIYAKEEGRGFGTFNKINAYAQTEKYNMDTVDAMIKLTGKSENRKFDITGSILKKMGVKSVNLFTNNPRKIIPLEDRRIKVNKINIWMDVNSKEEKFYVEIKKKKMEHINKYENSK